MPIFVSVGGGGFTKGEGGKAQESKPEGLLPVTIKHILTAPEEGIKLFDQDYMMIKFVAIVRKMEHTSTKITYTLEDNTGQIDGHLWLEESDDTTPEVCLNQYVRIFGSMRNQGGVRSVMLYSIDMVHSPNEVTTHMLEVLNARYMGEKLARGGGVVDEDSHVPAPTANGGFIDGEDNLGLTGRQLALFKHIKGYTGGTFATQSKIGFLIYFIIIHSIRHQSTRIAVEIQADNGFGIEVS